MAKMIDIHSLHDLLHWTLLSLDTHILNYFVSTITPFFNIQLDLTSRIMQALIYFYDIRSKQEQEDFETITEHLSSQVWIISEQLHSSLMILISTLHFKQQMTKIISNNQENLNDQTQSIVKIQQQQPCFKSIMQTNQLTPNLQNIIKVNLFNDSQSSNYQPKTQDQIYEKINSQEHYPTDIICFCQDSKRAIKRNNKLYLCKRCSRTYHWLCMKSNSICPYCQLQSQNPAEKIQYCVALIYQTKQLTQSQTIFYVGNMKRNQNLQCRSVRIDRLGNNKSSFPQNFSLYMNSKQIHSHSNLVQQTKKQMHIQIPRLSIYSQNNNSIIIKTDGVLYNLRKQKKNTQNYLIGLFITQNNKNVDPIKEIIAQNYLCAKDSLRILKKCWQDDDLYFTLEYSTFKFSAICPSRKKAMIIPARGKSCTHYSCFDLVFFLEIYSNMAKNTRKCPICEGSASELIVDSFIQSIILSKQRSPAIAEIRFLSNGYYTLVDLSGNQIEKNKISDAQILDKRIVVSKVYEIINSYQEEGIYIH